MAPDVVVSYEEYVEDKPIDDNVAPLNIKETVPTVALPNEYVAYAGVGVDAY